MPGGRRRLVCHRSQYKMRTGRTEAFYERYLLRFLGIVRLVGR